MRKKKEQKEYGKEHVFELNSNFCRLQQLEEESQRKQSSSIPVSTIKTSTSPPPLTRQQKLEQVGARVGADQAEFYLDMSGWDVDTAIALYNNLTS